MLRSAARLRWFSSCTTLLATLLSASTAAAAGPLALVSNGDDGGPGSFRAAVAAANADPGVRSILFAPGLTVTLGSDVVFTGAQPLAILGNGSEVVGDPAAAPAETWDGGLFVSAGGANLAISRLAFRNSFNNGIAVFVPETRAGRIALTLNDVDVEGARFHGVFFDGQHTTGLNTDDVLHPDCFDPHPVDAPASMSITIKDSTVVGNGTLAGGFDTGTEFEENGETFLTGCPADFDGVRVDDGGPGDIKAFLASSRFEGNLADGVELDDSEEGGVHATIVGITSIGNGDTGTADPDDGFDIDEAGPGDLVALVVDSVVSGNFDEGLDFSEENAGSASATLIGVEASENEDEGFKLDETEDGDLRARVFASAIDGSLSQQGVELVELGAGVFDVAFVDSHVGGNDDEGLLAEQEAPGTGVLKLVRSDFTGNGDPSLDLAGVELVAIRSQLDE
jgi:hypothetical protein